MKKLFLLSIVSGLLAVPQPLQAKQEPSNTYGKTLITLLAVPALHLGLGLAHQLGHILVAQLLLKCGAEPLSAGNRGPNQPIGIDWFLRVSGTYPEFKSELLNALVELSGPAAGLVASYAALKATNIATELSHEKSLMKAIKKGLKKPFLHDEQSTCIKGIVGLHSLINTGMLVPFSCGNYTSEGEIIRQSLFKYFR